MNIGKALIGLRNNHLFWEITIGNLQKYITRSFLYPYLTHLFYRSNTPSYPNYIAVELTNSCNLTCTHCNYRYGLEHYTRPRGQISLSLFKKIIDELASHGTNVLMNYDGEPLMHPQFLELARYASEKDGLGEISFNTNGMLFNKEFADNLIKFFKGTIFFSIDGGEKFHNKLRKGSDYSTVIKNLEYFLKLCSEKNNIKVGVNLCNIGQTDEEIRNFYMYWIKKVDIVNLGEVNDEWGKLVSLPMNPFVPTKRPMCNVPWSTLGITWNGDVVSCSIYITRANTVKFGILGNIKEKSIQEIWCSDILNEFRQKQLSMKLDELLCKGCDRWKGQIYFGSKLIENASILRKENAFWTIYSRVK